MSSSRIDLVAKIKGLTSCFIKYNFFHIFRKENSVANWFAKLCPYDQIM